ncbi:MAG: adenylate synthase [Saprospiraceae bacterium]|nr:adenylate synthase [Saprospiraceae bacterium]
MFFKLQILYFLVSIKVGKWFFNSGSMFLRNGLVRRLKNHLKQSPFYKPFVNNGFVINSFPIVNKKIFMDQFDQMNTRSLKLDQCMELALKAEASRDFSPMIRDISVGLSTGTSGNRGLFLTSVRERAMWVSCILDRVIGFSFKKRKIAFFLRANNNLYKAVQSGLLEFHFFDIFQSMDDHILKLNKLKPNIIVAQPSVLIQIASAIQSGQIFLSPEKIISVAEVLTPEDKSFLERIFLQNVHQVYQCTEGFLAATCTYGILHFNEDFLIIEKKYIDSEKIRFHPIITDLLRSTQPVVRYELNDILIEKENCACGSRMMAIESIEGRSDDVLVFKNQRNEKIKLFPDLFRKIIILSDEFVIDYCLIQKDFDYLKLYIHSDSFDSYKKVSAALINELEERGVENTFIERLGSSPFVIGEKKRRVKNEMC